MKWWKLLAATLSLAMLLTPSAIMEEEVRIDETNFPDEVFREFVKQKDTDGNGSLSETERNAVKQINVMDRGVTSLKGIEYFTALKELDCKNNKYREGDEEANSIKSLDVSKNTALEDLICSGIGLEELDVSKNTALKTLYCDGNALRTLNLSNNPALDKLDCGSNELESLDVSQNKALRVLSCRRNLDLKKLDLSNNLKLLKLSCDKLPLGSLDVSGLSELIALKCAETGLTTLDVTKNAKLGTLICNENQLTKLDLSQNSEMGWLECEGNELTALDIRNAPGIGILNCMGNQLTSLDVSKQTGLEELYCSGNALESLDLSANPALVELRCADNKKPLGTLDLSKNDALKELECQNSGIQTLTLSQKAADLESINCAENQMAGLNVGANTKLHTLLCNDNQLTGLDIRANTLLRWVECQGNTFTELDISRNPRLVRYYKAGATSSEGGVTVYGEEDEERLTVSDAVNLVTEEASPQGGVVLNDGFTDAVFREKVREFDANGDGVLSETELRVVQEMDVSESNIADLSGIEHFTALKVLNCSKNSLSALDVSRNTALEELDCASNRLETLNISDNPALKELACTDNRLTKLDVQSAWQLFHLYCEKNQIAALDLTPCPMLYQGLRQEDRQVQGGVVKFFGSDMELSCDESVTINGGRLPRMLKVPESWTYVGPEAFAGADVELLVLGEDFEFYGGLIDSRAFANCKSLRTVSFGNIDGSLRMSADAFEGCGDLYFVTFDGDIKKWADAHGIKWVGTE